MLKSIYEDLSSYSDKKILANTSLIRFLYISLSPKIAFILHHFLFKTFPWNAWFYKIPYLLSQIHVLNFESKMRFYNIFWLVGSLAYWCLSSLWDFFSYIMMTTFIVGRKAQPAKMDWQVKSPPGNLNTWSGDWAARVSSFPYTLLLLPFLTVGSTWSKYQS